MKSSPLKSTSVWLEALKEPRGLHKSAKLQLLFLYAYSFLSCCDTGFSRGGDRPQQKNQRGKTSPGLDTGGAWRRTSSSSESHIRMAGTASP